MKKFTHLFILLIFLVSMPKINAQGLIDNNWYFGNSDEGIRFNKTTNEPTLVRTQGTPFGTGGSAVATDPVTGDLLFYTDGNVIFDASHRIMAGSLGSNTDSNQPVAISPVPGADKQYYVFSNPAAPGMPIIVSIVDMNLPGNATGPQLPLGGLVSTQASSIISETEAMTVIRGDNNQNWLVAQNGSSITISEILSTLPFIIDNSITDPQIQAINFAFNEEKNLIAIVPGNANVNIKIYQFDPSLGGITVEDTIQNSARSGELLYDAAWSPDGEKLFFSRSSTGNGVAAQIYQYYADSVAPQPVLPNPVYRSYGLQTGPDGRLYHLFQEAANGPFEIGRLENPDSIQNYDFRSWEQAANFNGQQFPQFSAQADFEFDLVEFEVFDLCANGRTKFVPSVLPAYDSLIWNIADTTINAISPELTFDAGGDIEVTLTAYLNGIDSAITQTISIIDNPYEISLPSNDTTVCASAFPGFILKATIQSTGDSGEPPPPLDIYWSNNPNEVAFNGEGKFDSTGTYYAVAITPSGCTITSSVDIKICQEEKRVGNIWFFGDRAGIDFNPEQPIAIPDSSVMNAPAGTSTISDRNGRVLFYTDGQTVWNRNNEIMPNGTDIGGDQLSSQSALIIPFPGDPTRYYIFTTGIVNGAPSEIRYSIVDMKVNNTLGDVESMTKGTVLFPNSTEKITAVEAGDTTWLLMHEVNNSVFRAYPISSGGIGQYVESDEGTAHSSGKGYMKFSTDGSRVAAAHQGPPGFVELFNFDDSSGFVTDPIKFDFPNEAPYGVEFSPDSEKLYISTASGLYQYHVNDTLTNEEVIASKKLLETSANLGALQLGPNGQIYGAVDGSTELLVINGPNVLQTDTSNVSISTFSLLNPDMPGDVTSRLGLPNFVQSIMEPISDGDFDFEGQCFGDQTEFTAIERCDTDKFAWQILDGSNRVIFSQAESDEPEAFFEFPAPGLYSVSLTLSNPCEEPADTTITKEVEIFAPPADPGFPEVIGLCEGDTLLTAGPATDEFQYFWSTGDTINEVRIDRPGNFSVLIINTVTGCSETYATTIEYTVPEVELGPNLILCQGDTPNRLDAGSGGSSFEWTINGAQAGTTRQQSIATDVPGDFLYKVIKTGPLGCEVKDSVMVTVNGRPTFAATPIPTSSCGLSDGSISIDNNGVAGNFSFLWSTGETTQNISGLTAGFYNVTITDETTGCEQEINNIEVEDNNSTFDIVSAVPSPAACGASDGSITVTLDNGISFPLTYELFDALGNSISGIVSEPFPEPPSNDTFIITDLEAGVYGITVTSISGCVQTSSGIVVEEPEKVAFDVTDFVEGCGGQAVISATSSNPSVSFNWTTVNGVFAGVTNGPDVGVTQSGTYTVTASFAGQCDSVRTVEVQLDPAPDASITQSGDECNGQYTLTAVDASSGSAGNSYRWTRGTTVVGNTQTIIATQSGTYTVEILRPGCSDLSDPVTLDIFEEPTVSISFDAACSPEEPFTLYASATPSDVQYTWFYPNGNLIPGQGLDSVRVRDDGTYRVRVENGSCFAEAEVTVIRNDVGESTLPEGEVIICPSSSDPRRSQVSINADSTNSFIIFRWELDGQPFNPGENRRSFKPKLPGLYYVAMINGDGCIIEDEVRVVLVCKPIIFVPNAIRPGSGIGPNRTFRIFTEDNISDDEFQVYIFNRWGEMIFQSRDKNFEWDGTFKGNEVPVSTYSYVIHYKGAEDPKEELYEVRGGVTVIR